MGPNCIQKEGGEEIDELEGVPTRTFLVQRGEDAGGDDEEDERHDEADGLHTHATVGFVVEKQSSEVVSYQLTTDVD